MVVFRAVGKGRLKRGGCLVGVAGCLRGCLGPAESARVADKNLDVSPQLEWTSVFAFP